LGDAFDIRQVRISLSNIHLQQVTLQLPNQKLLLYIDDLCIGYNPFRLIAKGFDPKAISQDILLINPRLIISLGNEKGQSDQADTSNAGLNFGDIHKYRQKASWLKFLSRFSVKEGEIYCKEADGRLSRVAHAIEGSLSSESPTSTVIRLSGKVFSSQEKNLLIDGEADPETGLIRHVQFILKNYNLQDNIPLLNTETFKFSAGKMNAFFELATLDEAGKDLKLDGELTIAGASAQIGDESIRLDNIQLKADIRDWNLQIAHSSLLVNGAPLIVSGSIFDLAQPVFDLQAQCSRLEIAPFASLCGERLKGKCRGKADVQLKMVGPAKDIRIEADLASRQIRLKALPLRRVHLSSEYQNRCFTIHQCAATVADNNFLYSGEIDFSAPAATITGSITMQGDMVPVLRSLAADSLTACITAFHGNVSGLLTNPLLAGDLTAKLYAYPADTIEIGTRLTVQNNLATFQSTSQEEKPQLTGNIDFAGASPRFELWLENAERLPCMLWRLPFEPFLAKNLALSLNLLGKADEFSLAASIRRKLDSPPKSELARVSAEIKRDHQLTEGEGQVWLYPIGSKEISGSFSFQKDKAGHFTSDFSLGEELSASFAMITTIGEEDSVSGKLSINDFKLAPLIDSPGFVCTGNLNGRLDLAGTKRRPVLNGSLRADEMFYNQVGPYSSEMTFGYHEDTFSIEKFTLSSSQATLLYADGEYHLPQDSLDFSVKGAGFDINTLVAALGKRNANIAGRSLVDLRVIGSLSHPRLIGFCAIKQGSLLTIPFDELELRLGERNAEKSGQWPDYPVVDVSRLRVTRQNEFEIIGSGFVPLSTNDSLRLQLEGKGNFLVMFHDISDYFGNSSSAGVLSATLSGTLTDPALESASLSFRDGRMEFGSVIPLVTELSGRIQFEPAEQFVHVLDLEGKMGGEWFRISNTLATAELASRPIENLVLSGSGFNFGVTMLETTERGVPVNVLGLMEEGVFGRIELIGHNSQEKFYFAGPARRPLVRGRVNLYGIELMYPMEETGEPLDEFVQNLLWNIEWDLFAFAAKDVRYVKTLPGALDKVYVDLLIDDQYGGLDFTGQLADSSFRIEGEARCATGHVEYLDMDFHVEEAGVEFDRNTIIPVVYGRGVTTVSDSTGIPSQVIIALQTVDETMDNQQVDDMVRQEKARGRFDEIRFKVTTDNPNLGTTEAQILASLGYSTETLQTKAVDAIGISTENLIFRPLYRPMERKLEQLFGLDYVRFSSRFARNLLALNMSNNYELSSRLALLRSTKLILGKYLADRFFLQYTGQVEAGIYYRYKQKGVGLHHILGLEYRINPQILLELEYDYDSLMLYNRDDKRVVLRHWFPF